jgi:hypothetical protein
MFAWWINNKISDTDFSNLFCLNSFINKRFTPNVLPRMPAIHALTGYAFKRLPLFYLLCAMRGFCGYLVRRVWSMRAPCHLHSVQT